jgi:hypothetical protein
MKKLLLLTGLLIAFVTTFAQTVPADRVTIRQSLFLRDRWVDTVKNDTTGLINRSRTVLTSKAIYDFVVGRTIPDKPGFGMSRHLDTLHAGGLVPGILHYWIPNNLTLPGKGGFIRFVNRQNSDSVEGFGPYGGGRYLVNEGLLDNDATYAPSMMGFTRIWAEEFGDTAQNQYGGILSLYQRRVFDSTGSIFGPVATRKFIKISDVGTAVTNQVYPPKDSTDWFVGKDGQAGASFESIFGLGGSWGYNVHFYSNLPDYPYSPGFEGVLDLQREASRTRLRRITGNGISSFTSQFRGWQATITGASPQVGHYISKVYGFTAYGNTDYDIISGTTKAYGLGVETIDTVAAFIAMPQWRTTNTVKNGYSFIGLGDSDVLYHKGYVYFGPTMPTHDNLWPQYRLTVVGDQVSTGSIWLNAQTGRIAGTSNTPTNVNPGTVFLLATDSSEYVFMGSLQDKGAWIKTVGNNISDAARGGVDVEIHYGQNLAAPFRIHFRNYDGIQENRYWFQRNKMVVEVIDSISLRAAAYKLAGMPTGLQTFLLTQDANGYTYKADTGTVFQALRSKLDIANTRSVAQTAANANILTYAVGSSDGTFQVSANVLVTTSTTHSFTVTVDYTDESNVARTLTLSFSQLTGTVITAITNVTGAGPYEGVGLTIRAKAGTNIVFKSAGTFTTVTYNVDVNVLQLN